MKIFEKFIPYRDRPLCFCDIETTGTKPGYHEIIEIACKHQKFGLWTTQVSPQYIDRADEEALKISKYNTADWVGAPSFKDISQKFAEYLSDCTVVGHNFIAFDALMIKGNYEMHGLSTQGLLKDIIDTMILARTFLVPEGLNMINMGACRKFFNKDYDEAHNAYQDCIYAEELYNDIMKSVRFHGLKEGKYIQETLF